MREQCIRCEQPIDPDTYRDWHGDRCPECAGQVADLKCRQLVDSILTVYSPTRFLRAITRHFEDRAKEAHSMAMSELEGTLWRLAGSLNDCAEQSESLRCSR